MTAVAPLRVVVVDDEPPALRGLSRLLEGRDGVEIVGQCADAASAVRVIRERRPDLVLLDVQMSPTDGFGVLRAVGDEAPAVIFVTAHERFAVAAFEYDVLDYLLKPYSEARLEEALRRARAAVQARRMVPTARPGSQGVRDRLVVRALGRVDVVPVDEIVRIAAAGYCVTIHTGTRRLVHREPLQALEARLPADRFVRLHRATIVNVEHIRQVRTAPAGGHDVLLLDGSRHRVSRRRWTRVTRVIARWDRQAKGA
ncbi:MAG: LytTR family DNA-binding domain-containing protein [Vicinamibacterales bacterium]